jgi:hypothetical protein
MSRVEAQAVLEAFERPLHMPREQVYPAEIELQDRVQRIVTCREIACHAGRVRDPVGPGQTQTVVG